MSRLMIVEVPSYSCEFKGIREVCELVRCKDCKYASHWRTLGICAVTNQRVKADDFCSYGERLE